MTTLAEPPADTEPATIALEILTDEELSVLVPTPGVVVQPVLADVPDTERDAVRRTAFRGLVARGIVEAPDRSTAATASATSAAGGDVAVDLRVRNDVLSALTLRQSASAVVAVARTTAEQQDYWYAHVVEEIALLEEVGTDGLHRFALGHARDLPALLAAAALHPDAVDGEGERVELAVAPDSEAPEELVERLGAAYVRADCLVLTRTPGEPVERPELTGLFSGPQGSWSITAKPGSQRAFAGPETVASLRERTDALAAHAVAHAAGATA